MESTIYRDIAERTDGNIYIGVVGPVRTGKSTLIKQIMETLVLPNIENENSKSRARDEMPQSASGRTVMTTEPKFIPEEAATIRLDGDTSLKIKMVDCVGYLVDGALGHTENGEPRIVMTPWSNDGVPFEVAAETGTHKVISEHATIGIMVTTDGSISEIPRESYIAAEKRVATELNAIGKPFVIVLNSAYPESTETMALAEEMAISYKAPVMPVNCMDIGENEIKEMLRLILDRFPIKELRICLPTWTDVIGTEHDLNKHIKNYIKNCANVVKKIGDIRECFSNVDTEMLSTEITEIKPGCGSAHVTLKVPEKVFYEILGEIGGLDITDERSLVKTLTELAYVKTEYEKVAEALKSVNETGYGIVKPAKEDLTLEEPEIVKQPSGYGVKLKASAPSIHMIKADITAEVNPTVGSETQSEELVKFLLKEFEEDPAKLWETNMFGKTLYELIEEGLTAKLSHMPDEARLKLSETLQRIINEGSGGLICILL